MESNSIIVGTTAFPSDDIEISQKSTHYRIYNTKRLQRGLLRINLEKESRALSSPQHFSQMKLNFLKKKKNLDSQQTAPVYTARSLEDEPRNAERNTNRHSEWWGNFSQLVKIEKNQISRQLMLQGQIEILIQ